MRMVFDTNVLIDGIQDDFNAQAKLIDTARDGEITAVVTRATQREYKRILRRLINDPQYKDRIEDFLWMAEEVNPGRVHVQIDDTDDIKFLEAAIGGNAEIVVTKDRHLLDIGELDHVRIVTPQEAWIMYDNESDGAGEWREMVAGWLGK